MEEEVCVGFYEMVSSMKYINTRSRLSIHVVRNLDSGRGITTATLLNKIPNDSIIIVHQIWKSYRWGGIFCKLIMTSEILILIWPFQYPGDAIFSKTVVLVNFEIIFHAKLKKRNQLLLQKYCKSN